MLSGSFVAGSFHQIPHGPSEGLWQWGARLGKDTHASGGMVDTPVAAKDMIAVAFRRNIARIGLAERPDATPPKRIERPPAAPAPMIESWAPPPFDRWFDRDHPRVLDWPRRAELRSGDWLVGRLNEHDRAPWAGRWSWALSGTETWPGDDFCWKGEAATIDDAFACLEAAWAHWVFWAGLVQKEPLRRGAPVRSLC